MPIYEFECKNCGNLNEYLMKMSDPNPTTCEYCQSGPLVKIVSKSNFVLKGQGWYETDFKDKPKNNDKSSDTNSKSVKKKDSESTKTEGGTSETSDKKSEPKDSPKPSKTNSTKSSTGSTSSTSPSSP